MCEVIRCPSDCRLPAAVAPPEFPAMHRPCVVGPPLDRRRRTNCTVSQRCWQDETGRQGHAATVGRGAESVKDLNAP